MALHTVAMTRPTARPGCPRHARAADRSCPDMRCLRTWKVPGAPTAKQQLDRWMKGDAVCPNRDHECCPDFACCRPGLGWPESKRRAFVAATPREREKMMMGALEGLAASAGQRAYVTRGDPRDRG